MLDRRLHMVNSQLRTGGVVDKAVLAAFLEVPRQRFVAPEHESLAYLDRELPARGAKVRRLLAPMVLARMLQAVTVVPGDRALDVGGRLGLWRGHPCRHGREGRPPGIRRRRGGGGQERTSQSRERRCGRGPLDSGAAALGPFDLIVVEGAFGVFPDSLIALLADPGRLVGIDASSEPSQAVVYEKSGGAISRRALFETKADILDGFKPGVSFAF